MTRDLINNLKIKAELLQLSQAFDAQGIEHVVLKGVPLVLRLYRQLDARFIGDNDILVREHQQSLAIEALKDLGYRPKHDPGLRLRYDGRASFVRSTTGDQHGDAFVDLHREAFDPLLFRVPNDLLWQHVEPFDLGGHRVQVLDRSLTLLHQGAHCAQHAMMEARTLRDLARAWNDWSDTLNLVEIEQLAQRYGLLDALMFALWVANDLGMVVRPLPGWHAPRAQRLRRVLTTRRLFVPSADLPYLRMAAMGALLSGAQQRHFLRTQLFPPQAKLGAIYKGVPLWGRYAIRLARPLMRLASRKLSVHTAR